MGIRLMQVSETFPAAEDQSWLGSAHGTTECDTITLDKVTCLAAFPTGVVPSGVALGKITANGRYAPFTAAATHGAGTDTAAGLLFQTVDFRGTTAGTTQDSPAALFWHGEVVEANLPVGHGVEATAKVDLNMIRFV
jgi:hypothetical protein